VPVPRHLRLSGQQLGRPAWKPLMRMCLWCLCSPFVYMCVRSWDGKRGRRRPAAATGSAFVWRLADIRSAIHMIHAMQTQCWVGDERASCVKCSAEQSLSPRNCLRYVHQVTVRISPSEQSPGICNVNLDFNAPLHLAAQTWLHSNVRIEIPARYGCLRKSIQTT